MSESAEVIADKVQQQLCDYNLSLIHRHLAKLKTGSDMKRFFDCTKVLCLAIAMPISTQADGIGRTGFYPWEGSVGYTQIVEAGGFVFFSGVISAAPDFDDQMSGIYRDIEKQLALMNLDASAIVKETIYTTDITLLKRANSVRHNFYAGFYPTSTWVEVEGLYYSTSMIEVEVMAVRP